MKRHHWFLYALFGFLILSTLFVAGRHLWHEHRAAERQDALDPFYQAPADLADLKPGAVIRSEPLGVEVPNGQAMRVLYRSELADGTPNVSSGMVFVPNQNPTAGQANRPVVAWAHGTIGLGESCAPSRAENPLSNMDWLAGMLARGWVVTATDYAGLGTEGPQRYLVGKDEARDVLNSVRAAKAIDPQIGTNYAVWGHSQGGHSALFSSTESAEYAPELKLIGTAAAAPAAELVSLFSQQYTGAASWIIGPDVLVSWPGVYPGLDTSVVSDLGQRKTEKLANECIAKSAGAALYRNALKQQFFSSNPMDSPTWRAAATDQTPPLLSSNQPLLIVQSLADKVVLPNTTAQLIQRTCTAGTEVATIWLDQVSHQDTAIVAGPTVTDWLADRFAGRPTVSSCDQPLPIAPASS